MEPKKIGEDIGNIPNSSPIVLRRWAKHYYYFINGNLDDRTVRTLKNELSFFIQGYEKTDAFKRGTWNGQETLFYTSKHGVNYFPAGLLPQVVSVLNAYKVKYTVEVYNLKDHLAKYPNLGLGWHGPPLRDYQIKAISDIVQRGGGVLSLPTGGGKTLIALKLIQMYDVPTLIVVHRRELMRQWIKEIEKNLHYKAARFGAGTKDRFEYITVGLMQSLIRYKGDMDFPILIADECHHVPSTTLYSIAMNCNAPVRLGLSATPRREQGDDLKIWAAVGGIASDIRPMDLIAAGFLSKPEFMFLRPPPINLPYRSKWNDVYLDGIVTNQERNGMIIDVANKFLDNDLLTYIHVERIDHGEYLAEHIEGASFVCGTTPKKMRDHMIDSFTDGKRRCLVSTLLGEGVDIPSIQALIMAGGLKTTIGAIQKIGRALRIKPGKNSAIIVDFVDHGPYIGKHWAQRYETYKEYYGNYCPDFAIGRK